MMALLNKKDIELLDSVAADLNISIYIPTHREGEAVNNDMDKVELKNSLQDLEQQLSERGLKAPDIENLLQKAWKLVEDESFWRQQSDGLAIFIAKDFFRYYELPLRFKRRHVISNCFYLKPLMPMLTGDGRFFILTLNRKMVKMYEGSRYSITEVYIDDLVPKDMEDALSYDNPQTQLQYKTIQTGHEGTVYHGHGAGKDQTDDHLKHFCQLVDKGLMKMLHDEKPPLVLIADDHLTGIYKSVNTYRHFLEDSVRKNPKGLDPVYIHELAWEKVEPYFKQAKKNAVKEYVELKHTEKTSNEVEEILSASKTGRVGKLLIGGNGNGEKDSQSAEDMDINHAAIQTILNDGGVYFVNAEDKPENKKILAVLRY